MFSGAIAVLWFGVQITNRVIKHAMPDNVDLEVNFRHKLYHDAETVNLTPPNYK